MSARARHLMLGPALGLALAAAATARAQDAPAPPPAELPAAPAAAAPSGPDTSGWACRFCALEEGWQAWLEPRLGLVSDSSYRFGDFTGLHEDGGVGDLAGGFRWRAPESGDGVDASLERAGLDSAALGIHGGRAGLYEAWFRYEALPHYVAADGASPFRGDAQLALPAGWTTAGSTGGMAGLDAALRGVSLDTKRERTALGASFVPHRLADLRVEYRRDELRGTGLTGGSFLTLASQLPRPVDQTLDRVDASLAWRGGLGHAQLAFESSFFSNGARALAWENPYNPLTPGATAGRLAQAPDNSAYRASLAAGTAPGGPLQASAQLALGRHEQDARFLPATTNPDEAVVLPRASLDGRVDTLQLNARASYALGRYRVTADLLRDDRDNRTAAAAYTQVVMDTFTGDVRTNAPFGFTRDRWRVSAERRASPRVAVGLDEDRRERRLHGVGETTERRYWGRVGWRPFDGADLKLRLAHGRREGNEYAQAADAPLQNPRLRAYNTAERERDEARADFSLGAGRLTQAFHVLYARDDYPDSVLGRTSGDELGYGADIAAQVGENLSWSAFASHRERETGQAGSQAFGAPDWLADQEDASNALGAGVAWRGPRGFDFGADYALATSAGSITMLAAAAHREFPVLATRWHDARVFGRYAWRPDLSLRLDVLYERYTARDWGLDGLAPDTVGNLVALGQGTQDGSVTAILLGARYTFGGAAPADD
jgi:MtrB/PioB family decaheme-associated outer membrane protein